jgi:molybdopterin-binding protein
MRKVLSFVLVLSLVLGSFGMAFAAPLSDVAGEKCEEAVNVLTDLGVVTGYPDGSYKPENIVTRAEMAVIVVRALGLADYAVGTAKFSDMAGHWSNPYVAYATGLGIIDGYPDGTFKPDNTVSYDEAAKMLVAALGYTPDSLTGTWPANYVVKAKSLGILDGIKAGAAGANRGDIATMTFQTLDGKIGTTDKDGKWEANDPEDTMLDRLGAELYNDGDAFVVTDDIAMDESVINLYPYIGAYIKAYQNSDGDIIAVKDVKSTFLTGSVKDNGKFKADGVEYNIDGAVYTNGITKGAIEFLNGAEGSTIGAVVKANGTVALAVKLSGKTIKEIYSVSTWTVTEHDFFSSDDAADIKADKKLFGIKFAKDDNNDIDLNSFALFGAASLEDISKDDVVYVYAAENKTANDITRIEVGTEVVTGKVTRISGDDFTIDGKVYAFAEEPATNYKPGAGDTVKIHLDYAGDIYKCVKEKGEADKYAIVLDVANGTPGFAGKDAKINLFLADGTEKAFAVDEEEVTDSILKAGSDKIEWLSNDVTTGAIIKYGVDKDGVIDEIVTKVNVDKSGATDIDITKKGVYDKNEISSDVVIFTVEAFTPKSKEADDYGITTLEKVLDSKAVMAKYVLDKDKIVAMLIKSDVAGGDDVFGVVVDSALNDSDAGYEITLLIGKTETTYDAKKIPFEAADSEKLYKLAFNTSGDITSLGAIDADIVATSAAMLKVSGNVVTITSVAGIETPGSFVDGSKITLDRDVVVYKWNVNDKCYEVGAVRDIQNTTKVVEFYDAIDDDGVYDFVLITKDDSVS